MKEVMNERGYRILLWRIFLGFSILTWATLLGLILTIVIPRAVYILSACFLISAVWSSYIVYRMNKKLKEDEVK